MIIMSNEFSEFIKSIIRIFNGSISESELIEIF